MPRPPRAFWVFAVLTVVSLLQCQAVRSREEDPDVKARRAAAANARVERAQARRRDPNFSNVTASVFDWQARFLANQGDNTTALTPVKNKTGTWWKGLFSRDSADRGTTAIVNGECELTKKYQPAKDYLVIVAVGDTGNPLTWLNHAKWANFDLVAVYFGDNAYFDCPQCKKVSMIGRMVYHGKAQKFRLFYSLHQMPEWKNLTAQYKAVMTADDDLVMSTCEINRAFEIFEENNLLMGQISLCETQESFSYWRLMYQQPDKVLRYVSFVEIMAPIFTMRDGFYDEFIVPTLYDAYTGWGLDFVWPFLLKYPKNRIAVIDEVCMVHPSKKLSGQSIYSSGAPYDQRVEEARREAQFGYTRAAVRRLGYPFYAVQEFGALERQAGGNALDRMDLFIRARLGRWFPLLLGAQTFAIAVGLLLVAIRLIRRRVKGKRV
ncbi:hypothetical protein F751_4889 [Auxenochlorella protothecoides]|uniref:Uncharacterized protein n=1 Tax=Auxenochlorella protothecoides TaxID=3075 RepID=A0A087SKZ2_AUXPR|nr:hypothetical protein F751_4889 [Auxenochlorella protothecoides]KFM26396.1 hypothetical protein F751_4889 [Auxenochlorella protothecoides]RMZ54566.1 hypothetical protein APUTEX25_002141 [Auxenochlorella protothecoides]|eukprot:RMZ54566.1 hypothetical protein APUTEX25_002141 [Auxenochlorella protothecoides]